MVIMGSMDSRRSNAFFFGEGAFGAKEERPHGMREELEARVLTLGVPQGYSGNRDSQDGSFEE